MMRVAVIDIGSNSVRLLVADVYQGKVVPVKNGLVTTRLGRGIGQRYLLPEPMEKTKEVLKEFLEEARQSGALSVMAAATSAVRDARNGNDFVDMIEDELGLKINILSGKEEALLTYQGVLAGLQKKNVHTIIIDLGGGSTEIIWPVEGDVKWESVDVGAVRATEGKYSREKILSLLKPVLDQIDTTRSVGMVGVGGTVTNLAAMAMELKVYNPKLVHGYTLSRDKLKELLDLLEVTPVNERKKIPGLQPERADIIEAGTRIIAVIMEHLNVTSMEISEADILYGLSLEVAQNVERKNGNTYQK